MHTFHWEQNSVLKTEMILDEAEGRKLHTWNLDVMPEVFLKIIIKDLEIW